MLLMCTVLRLSSVRSWHTLKLLNMAGSKQSSCLEPQNRQLPLATDCRLLEVQQKTPDWPPALVMPYSCCYSRRKAQAGWVVGTSPKKEGRRVGSSLQLQQSLSSHILQNNESYTPRLCFPPYFCTSFTAFLYLLIACPPWFPSTQAGVQRPPAKMFQVT